MKLDPKFIEEISQFETIYCLISGGYHSTASTLLLKDYGFENVILIHNDTGLVMKSSQKTIRKLIQITKYEYIVLIPLLKNETIWDVLKRSFKTVKTVRDIIKRGEYYDRTKFECCYKLKKKPAKNFYKQIDKNNFVVLNSLCPFESKIRGIKLSEIRKKDTFLRKHKKFGNVWIGYPFRDLYKEDPFLPYLKSKGFNKIQHSGCRICPILIAFDIYKAPQYYNSLKAMAKLVLPCFNGI